MADEQRFEGVTPVGRVISESIFEMTTSGYQGKVVDPNHFIQIAIPKTAGPGLQAIFDNSMAAAAVGEIIDTLGYDSCVFTIAYMDKYILAEPEKSL